MPAGPGCYQAGGMSEQIIKENLLAIADAYAKATGFSIATISRQFHGNQAFLGDFKKGERSITVSKMEEMLAAFRAGWPPGAKWPPTRPIRMGRRP